MAAVAARMIFLFCDSIVSSGSGQRLSARRGGLAVVWPDVDSGPRIVQGGRSPKVESFAAASICRATDPTSRIGFGVQRSSERGTGPCTPRRPSSAAMYSSSSFRSAMGGG